MDDVNRSVEALELALTTVGHATVVVHGRSMLPFVFPGARLHVVPASSDEVRIGDVVVVIRATHAVVHRVVERRGSHVLTRGDAFRRPDEPWPGERVIARVPGLALFRRSRSVPEAFARPFGRLVAAHGPKLLDVLFPTVGLVRRAIHGARRRVPGLVERRRRGLSIRAVTPADETLVVRYFRRRGMARQPAEQGHGTTPTHRLLLAFHGERAVGGVSIVEQPEDGDVLVYDLYVDASMRGLGLGTSLVRAARDEAARSFPGRRCRAEIRVTNDASRLCFDRAGFRPAWIVGEDETWICDAAVSERRPRET